MKNILIIILSIASLSSIAGIGGSGGGVSKTWESILKSENYQVEGGQVPMSKGISVLYTPVYETCVRHIESDPIIETKDKVYYVELDQNNKRIQNYEIISKSIRDFSTNPIKKYSLTVYYKNNKFDKIDSSKKFIKEFEIPPCEE